MKHLFSLIVTSFTILIDHATSMDEKRFVVTSNFLSANALYPRIRSSNLHCQKKPNTNLETKSRICRDIFATFEEEVYEESDHSILPLQGRNRRFYASKVINVYITFSSLYPIREYVFVCFVGKPSRWSEYYITDECNLNINSKAPEDYIAGRFIFFKPWPEVDDRVQLFGLAEIPAEASFSTDYSIENLYLKRKEKHELTTSRTQDPLCRLKPDEKVRICTAVFVSKYFHEKVDFSFTSDDVDGSCEQKVITFQTDLGKRIATGRKFEEWMMSCNPYENDDTFEYLLSQAYEPNKVFTYLQDRNTGDIFLETLNTNIRLSTDYMYNPEGIIVDEDDTEENMMD